MRRCALRRGYAGAHRSSARPYGRVAQTGRSTLLGGTALGSTLVFAVLTAPSPTIAAPCIQPPPPGAITVSATTSITCVNTEPRASATAAIQIVTQTSAGSFIDLYNSGPITGGSTAGIIAQTLADDSPITIVNIGPIDSALGGLAGQSFGSDSDVAIDNSGNIVSHAGGFAIQGLTVGSDSDLAISNAGVLEATAAGTVHVIDATTGGEYSAIAVENTGKVYGTSSAGSASGIYALSAAAYSPIAIDNDGNITATGTTTASGIFARAEQDESSIAIETSGNIVVSAATAAHGIEARTDSGFSHSDIFILNEGDISASASTGTARGITTDAAEEHSYTKITNVGMIAASGATSGYGVSAESTHPHSGIAIINAGTITATGGSSYGVHALSRDYYSDIVVQNYGRIEANGTGVSIEANYSSAILQNYGQINGGQLGVLIEGGDQTGIINRGSITADSLYAIKFIPGGGYGGIVNYGSITGFIKVFGLGNQFVFNNEAGGVFEARETSLFGGGGFFNQEGGTVHTAADPAVAETTTLSGLRRFRNKGLVSLQDGAAGDTLVITSGPYSHSFGYDYDLSFKGSGHSTLAVDAFLGGAGKSSSDILIIEGNVSGKTTVEVVDTNPGPGVLNTQGIPVVYVTGATPTGKEFSLEKPIDTGFFDYDLYFTPTGSGVWSLKSFLGEGAFVLPELITAAQDSWHQSSSTWFDRTADLRVLLNGGAALAESEDDKSLAPRGQSITPAVWVRASGGVLDRDASAGVTAYGRDYRFDLDRSLETFDVQSGIDLGKRGLLAADDILVFGALGGFVRSDLDYDAIPRLFNFSGGEVGGYATYLRGGLFVDTLLNVQFLGLKTQTTGFPSTLSATTAGVRTDAGYRFGSFRGGPFVEPLATIAVDWAGIEGFSLGGNSVSFDDEANVQGRLGVRIGTSTQLWQHLTLEPFVIGSLWGNLANDNRATLVSTGTSFTLKDDLQDVWGDVSAGVNVFNPSASTSVFAKLDVTFGEDLDGVGGKAGMRVSW